MLPAIKEEFIKCNTLEQGLAFLCQYGHPRLSNMDNGGWYCAIDMFVQGKGVDFKVASEFNGESPLEAVNQCCERMHKALKDLGL